MRHGIGNCFDNILSKNACQPSGDILEKRRVNQKSRILIVEDDMPLAMMMVSLLTRAGCETEVATTGARALNMARDGNFDLITLDVDLPDMSGFEICRRLKENSFCQTPIIFITGRPLEEDQRRGFELGAVDYIAKPFETFEFASRLLSHIKPAPVHA
jgi:DNA-binding response OmpR family regulator